MLMEDQLNRSSKRRIAAEGAGLMLRKSLLDPGNGRSDIIRVIGAPENVQIRAHGI